MIKVLVSKEKIEIKGHSGYNLVGKDIVCSAVSSIVITTINGILSINSKALTYKCHDDKLTIMNIHDDEVTVNLIKNMLDLLNELMEKYPKNINIEEI